MSVTKRISSISPSLTLAITAKAKAMKAEGKSVIGFGAGEPDFNTPQHIIDAAKAALDAGCTKYTPSSGLPQLRKKIAEKFAAEQGLAYDPSQIIVSSGAKHSIFNAMFALIEEGGRKWLGVPGIYDTREARAADLFGFPRFTRAYVSVLELTDEERNDTADFGHWCRCVGTCSPDGTPPASSGNSQASPAPDIRLK